MNNPSFYRGGVYIHVADGALVLQDIYGIAANQTIVDEPIATTVPATLFITLYNMSGSLAVASKIKRAILKKVLVAYSDSDGADQLDALRLFNGVHATEVQRQFEKIIWETGGIAEGVNIFNKNSEGLPTPVMLEEQGKLWFMTEWTTILNVEKAGEYFALVVELTDD